MVIPSTQTPKQEKSSQIKNRGREDEGLQEQKGWVMMTSIIGTLNSQGAFYMLDMRMFWFLAVAIGLVGVTDFGEADAKSWRCNSKRRKCLRRCQKKTNRRAKRCRRSALRKRQACLKRSYRKGKKCVRKLRCPQAKQCYKSCKDKNDPLKCYAKQGCAKLQASCYGSCQGPLGASLKTCMEETQMKFRWCKEQKKTALSGCSSNCPQCK